MSIQINYLTDISKIYNTFQGELREWCFRYSSECFSKRFRPSSPEELTKLISSVYYPAEIHFSVQKFINDKPSGWTFVIDIDSSDIEDKNYGCFKICDLLNKFKIFYLLDKRKHIWIPDWETCLINEWNELYGNNEFVKNLQTYIKSTCELNGIEIDADLWKDHRHLIRVPYTIHLKSKKIQSFQCDLETAMQLWTGEKVDNCKMTTLKYAENFRNFILTANKFGNLERLMTEREDTRICFEEKSYDWIEKILEKGVPKGIRSLILWLVLTPYLVNVKMLNRLEVESITSKWLTEKCKSSKISDRNLYNYGGSSYLHFKTKNKLPHKLSYLKENYPQVYEAITKLIT